MTTKQVAVIHVETEDGQLVTHAYAPTKTFKRSAATKYAKEVAAKCGKAVVYYDVEFARFPIDVAYQACKDYKHNCFREV